jgi:hypothetical protein
MADDKQGAAEKRAIIKPIQTLYLGKLSLFYDHPFLCLTMYIQEDVRSLFMYVTGSRFLNHGPMKEQ